MSEAVDSAEQDVLEIYRTMAALWPGITRQKVAEVGAELTAPPHTGRILTYKEMRDMIRARLQEELGNPWGGLS